VQKLTGPVGVVDSESDRCEKLPADKHAAIDERLTANIIASNSGGHMDIQLSRLGIIVLGTVLGLIIVGATLVSSLVALKRPDDALRAWITMTEGGKLIRLSSTALVIIAATFLALTGALTEGAAALLSSVAGSS
jgi:hypothetical protein